MIKKENGKFVVYSESGKKFGTYDTENGAKRRIRQMEMFKHMRKSAMVMLTPEASKILKSKITKSMLKTIAKNPKAVDSPAYAFRDAFRKALTPGANKMTYKDYGQKAKKMYNKLKDEIKNG